MLKIGFTIYSNRIDEFAAVARQAEAVGFDRVWVGEHIVAPLASAIHTDKDIHQGRVRPPVVASDDRFYDLWTMIGVIAASTTKLKIATGVVVMPYRHPLVTARACATAHALAKGRFSLGVAAGWLEAEFDALGVPFNKRGALTDEGLAILRKSLAGGVISNDGPHYPFPPLEVSPEPVDVPIIVGGISPAAVARAAAVGDGWVAPKLPFEQLLSIRERITKLRQGAGRGSEPFEYHMHMPSADIEVAQRWEDAGFEHGVVVFDDIHPEDPRETPLDAKLSRLEETAKRLGLSPP
ncbi:MAG: TIGR03619 family F420-dependent LLM class oxidoreductase [Pseudomonadota bacterium]|nr:TIGR03619 family F420-dependent LLM class oxidoreductase [Pseudomonadota bacterium]